jgi:hypothetical protein
MKGKITVINTGNGKKFTKKGLIRLENGKELVDVRLLTEGGSIKVLISSYGPDNGELSCVIDSRKNPTIPKSVAFWFLGLKNPTERRQGQTFPDGKFVNWSCIIDQS